ncbi:TPA: carbohydrate ABC transporter permease [Klebsiella variicola]|nr:carbohydrate ABC transporter permease [Klebsiella variicola]
MKRKGYIVLRYLAALAVAISILAPMLWLFLMSVSTTADLTRVPLEWLPRQWDFSRYGHLLSLAPGEPGALFLPALGNSLLVLVYCSLIVPFLTWMVKNQFDTLPQDIEQAARLDGLRIWQVLLRITLPLAKPMLGAAALFGWLLAWDEFFYALLFTSNLAAQTLPVTIAGFTAGRATDDGLVAAVGILASVPPLLIAIWLQKSLVSGLTNGGSKG